MNPVMCESVLQVAAHVIGCDATITLCGQAGIFELNVMMPVLALKLMEAIEFTANAVAAFTEKCVIGIEANERRCAELVESSLAMVTALAPIIGYDAAAKIAHAVYARQPDSTSPSAKVSPTSSRMGHATWARTRSACRFAHEDAAAPAGSWGGV